MSDVTCGKCGAVSGDCRCGTFPFEVMPDAPRFRVIVTLECCDCGAVLHIAAQRNEVEFPAVCPSCLNIRPRSN